MPYFHVVFTLPRPVADIAHQNKSVVYDLLLKTAAETLITIAADPKHLGARIGLTAVLHTWGSALTHHPHAHIIVPGGGFSPKPAPAQAGGQHWTACRPRFFLSVEVLSRRFRGLFLERGSRPPTGWATAASNPRSLCRSHPGRPKPASRCSFNPRPCLEPTNQIKHRRQIPVDRHHRRRELPRGFLPRGFSDAYLSTSTRACAWQASENP